MIQIAAITKATVQEAISKKIVVGFFVISAVAIFIIALFLYSSGMSATIDALRPSASDPDGVALRELIRSFQVGIGGLFYPAAVFLSLFITADIVPSTLDKGLIDLSLSKPLSRMKLISSRMLGAVAVAALCLSFFIIGIWLLFFLRTGLLTNGFLIACIPALVSFVSLYAISALIGLLTGSANLGIVIVYIYAAVIGPVLESRETFLFNLVTNETLQSIIDVLYYILPQISAMAEIVAAVIQNNTVESWLPFGVSLGSAAFFFALTFFFFARREY